MKIPVPPLGADATRGDDFEVFSAPSLVRFLSRGVQPPSQIYLKHTDVLQVGCASSQAGESVTFNYRLLRADGSLIKGQFIIQVPATRAVVFQSEPMAEGFLLSVSCKAAVATTRGQTFARAFLTAGSFGANQPSYTLMADYVTTQFAPAHPGGRVLAPMEGPGSLTTVAIANPAAGAQFSLTVPANARWNVQSIFAHLHASAAVANRIVAFFYTRGGAEVMRSVSSVVATSGTDFRYTGTQASPTSSTAGQIAMIALPSAFYLRNPDSLSSLTIGMDAADQWQDLIVAVEEWLDNV